MQIHKMQNFVTLANATHAVTITCISKSAAEHMADVLTRVGVSFSVSAHVDSLQHAIETYGNGPDAPGA
jgi:hypothetical protein